MAAPATGTSALDAAYDELAARDEGLARLIAAHGRPDPFAWQLLDDAGAGDPFTELVLHIVGQQISTRAATTIFGRLRDALGGAISAEAVARTGLDDLRGAGLSAAKARSLGDLAERVLDGRLSFERLERAGDAAAQAELVEVRGVGPWSAQMFLLHRLRRPDVFPAADIGLLRGAQSAFGLAARPSPDELAARAERWRPVRSYAAALLWTHGATAPA